MIIRWLGAFRGGSNSLKDSLSFEMNRVDEVAGEKLQKGKSLISQSKVGLLISPEAVTKRFNGDCYSSYAEDGRLVKGRNPKHTSSRHKEVFATPIFTAIVIKGRTETEGFLNLSKEAREAILKTSKQYNLPIYELRFGKLVQI